MIAGRHSNGGHGPVDGLVCYSKVTMLGQRYALGFVDSVFLKLIRRIIMSEPSRKGLESLLLRARDGDLEATNELFATCRAYVGFLARSHVDSWIQAKVDSSDLIQQTLMEAHQAFPKFNGQTEGEWVAWLKQILKHNATDFVRRFGAAKRRATLEIAISNGNDSAYFRAAPELSSGGESPSQVMVRREQEIQISEALATLPDSYQQVIALRNLQRLPFDEVAERMGRSRPATQMLWMRALKKLQAQMHLDTNS